MTIEIRKEEPGDQDAIHHLNLAAFDNGPEATLVDKLGAACKACLSFVAVEDNAVVGHILFTPVTVDGSSAVGMGLAPMAVLPSHQRKGIGSKYRLLSQWEGVPDEAFMVFVFDKRSLPACGGIARYRGEFEDAMQVDSPAIHKTCAKSRDGY